MALTGNGRELEQDVEVAMRPLLVDRLNDRLNDVIGIDGKLNLSAAENVLQGLDSLGSLGNKLSLKLPLKSDYFNTKRRVEFKEYDADSIVTDFQFENEPKVHYEDRLLCDFTVSARRLVSAQNLSWKSNLRPDRLLFSAGYWVWTNVAKGYSSNMILSKIAEDARVVNAIKSGSNCGANNFLIGKVVTNDYRSRITPSCYENAFPFYIVSRPLLVVEGKSDVDDKKVIENFEKKWTTYEKAVSLDSTNVKLVGNVAKRFGDSGFLVYRVSKDEYIDAVEETAIRTLRH